MSNALLPLLISLIAGAHGIADDYALCVAEAEAGPELRVDTVGDDGKALGLWQWHEPSIRQVLDEMGVERDWAQRGDPRLDPVVSTVAAMWAMSERERRHWWRRADEMCREWREGN